MTELVLSCPRFTRNPSRQRAGRILCPSQVPALTVNWTANGLGDTGRYCPLSRVIHWAKTSPDQAGQLLGNQSFSFLIWEQIYSTFLFLVNLYRQAFVGVFLPRSLILFEYLLIFYSNLYFYFNQDLTYTLGLVLY